MAEREYPSLFDGDDAALGLVDRSVWTIAEGRLYSIVDQEGQVER